MKNKINNLSDVFREAKKHLWDGGGLYCINGVEFICHAIEELGESPYEFMLCKQAKKIIQHRLGKDRIGAEYTVCDYLYNVLGIPREKLTDQKVQQYRKDWLTSLEEEFKPKLKPKKGYRIHHIDYDVGNNDLSNLTYVKINESYNWE